MTRKIKLLIVDDEERFLRTLAQRLTLRDFEVTPVNNGAQAVEIAKQQAFDLAIVEAWRLAQPFTNPPPGMVQDDGFIHIDDFGFHITIGRARAELTGIDPRQGVMFPGLQTTPGR